MPIYTLCIKSITPLYSNKLNASHSSFIVEESLGVGGRCWQVNVHIISVCVCVKFIQHLDDYRQCTLCWVPMLVCTDTPYSVHRTCRMKRKNQPNKPLKGWNSRVYVRLTLINSKNDSTATIIYSCWTFVASARTIEQSIICGFVIHMHNSIFGFPEFRLHTLPPFNFCAY